MMNNNNNNKRINRNSDKVENEKAGKERQAILDTVDTYALETGHSRVYALSIMYFGQKFMEEDAGKAAATAGLPDIYSLCKIEGEKKRLTKYDAYFYKELLDEELAKLDRENWDVFKNEVEMNLRNTPFFNDFLREIFKT
jgi:hypothetical protein